MFHNANPLSLLKIAPLPRHPRCCFQSVQKPLKTLFCQIMREIQEHKIKIYEFPETGDEEENRLVKKIKVPFQPLRLTFMMHTQVSPASI